MMKMASKKNRIKLYFLLAVFILPALLSSILFYYHDHFQLKTTNHGIFVNPPLEVSYLYSSMAHGAEKKWRILYIDDGICDKPCRVIMNELQQVKKALGKDNERVALVFLGGIRSQLGELTRAFQQQGNPDFNVKNKIYLIDPRGDLFMYYQSDADPMNILKDMKHLLGISQIG